MKTIELEEAEYQHFTTAIEGAIEELEELERDVEWFTTETIDRLTDCLTFLRRAEQKA